MQYILFFYSDSAYTGYDVAQAGFELLILFLPNAQVTSVNPHSVLLFYVYGYFASIHICISHACSAHGSQKHL